MATKNLAMIILIVSTILVIGAREQNEGGADDTMKLVTHDAVTLTLSEVASTKKFLELLPRLKIVRAFDYSDSPELVSCVWGLSDHLRDARSVLKRLRRLTKAEPTMYPDLSSLQRVVNRMGSLHNTCEYALGGLDRMIMVLLNGKLNGIVQLTEDVMTHVYRLPLK